MQLNQTIAAIVAAAAQTGPNMTETVSGGSGGRLLPEGYTLARMVEYVELGSQPQEFGGKAKDPKPEFQLGFALLSPGFANDDGTPYIVRPYSLTIDQNEKANAIKVFKTLNWKGTNTHYAQFLGEAFLLNIEHKPKDKAQPNGPKRSVVNLLKTLPPLDALTKQPYQVPDVPESLLRIFVWDHPTLEGWNSLYVEGAWDDGNSKNRTQETILGALDFAGSPLEQLLLTSGTAYRVPVKTPPKAAAPSPIGPGTVGPAGPVTPGLPPAAQAAGASPAPFVSSAVSHASAALPASPGVGTAEHAQPATRTTSPSNAVPGIPVFPTFSLPPQ